MSEDFPTEAAEYLLEQLAPAKRAAFEARLAQDAAARATLRATAEALAQFAQESAAPEAMLPADERQVLSALRAAAGATCFIAAAALRNGAPRGSVRHARE